MKAKPTVYVLCGFIDAGKITFARELEARTGAVRITKDEWLIRLIGNDPTIDGYAGVDAEEDRGDGRVSGAVLPRYLDRNDPGEGRSKKRRSPEGLILD